MYTPPSDEYNLNAGDRRPTLNCSHCLSTCHDSVFLLDYDTTPNTHSIMDTSNGHLDVYYKDLGAIKYRRESSFTLMQLIGNVLHIIIQNNVFLSKMYLLLTAYTAQLCFQGPFINYARMIWAIFDPPFSHVRVRKIFQTLPPLFLRNIPFRFST